jgi:lipopolysaccharide transport protein LptA
MLKLQFISRILRAVSIILFSLYLQNSFADVDEKVDIQADSLKIDRNNNVSTFEGSVVIEFKDMVLKTSQVKIIYESPKDNESKNIAEKIKKIILARHFIAYKKLNQKTEVIEADYAEYFPTEKKLLIKDNIKIIKDDKTIICNDLIYYTDIIKIHDKH